MKLWKTLTAHGFARNVKCLASQARILILSATWKVQTGLNLWWKRRINIAISLVVTNRLLYVDWNLHILILTVLEKKMELVAFLDFYKPSVVAVQETKIDETISSAELFPDSCPYNVYWKNRNLHGGSVMLLINKELPHMPLKELENDSESVWVKIFANGTSHYIASWYREPSGSCEDFQFFRNQLEYIKSQSRGNKIPSVHVLGDFNFREIVWSDRLNKNKTMLSQSDGQV